MIAADTSVLVAVALPWHEAHQQALEALRGDRSALIAHVAVETYSVLTRLPGSQRVPAPTARAFLDLAFEGPPIVLSAIEYGRLLDLVAAEGIVGGAVYDALVAATAREADATLVTLDRRALRTYRLVGADYRLIDG
ncbi:MAG: type II toxin-antitoxin system VapC family toxin [Gaiellaceae bacterium]